MWTSGTSNGLSEINVGFEVITCVKIKFIVLWDLTLLDPEMLHAVVSPQR
jgi:hypothetical protein